MYLCTNLLTNLCTYVLTYNILTYLLTYVLVGDRALVPLILALVHCWKYLGFAGTRYLGRRGPFRCLAGWHFLLFYLSEQVEVGMSARRRVYPGRGDSAVARGAGPGT